MRTHFSTGAIILLFLSIIAVSCRWRSVKGNGEIVNSIRKEGNFKSVKAAGSFDVYFSQGNENEIRIEADENLMQYIVTEVENNVLKIKTRSGVNIRPTQDIKVYVKAPQYKEVTLAGSGNMLAETAISSTEKISLSIAGSGDIKISSVDAPAVVVKIAGSGKAEGGGTTRDLEINVAGSGDVQMKELKAENAKVVIAGSGNVWVYASVKLDVRVAGGGDIHYYGNPTDIKSKLAGSGNLIKE
ncbi:MAG: DUF2807 domain-containing protein [Chitinophagaceae bacterium]|jgi:hypothetical protein|nr:DUF2807 domain-containing protein [Chitinophagaceae bacterium]